jgi:hypothetical protein
MIQRVARVLEEALFEPDALPRASPWWSRLAELHDEIAVGLEPDMWLSDEELKQLDGDDAGVRQRGAA